MIPWISMPLQPRSTVRAVIEVSPRYGIFYLAMVYAFQAIFYASNYWSLGLVFSWGTLLLLGVLASPILGWIWLNVMGSIFQLVGKCLGGHASRASLYSVVAWSQVPLLLFIPFWAFFISINPTGVFILGQGDPSPLLINGVSLVLGTWSQVLCIESIREVQGFSFFKALLNVTLAWVIYAISFFFVFLIARSVY